LIVYEIHLAYQGSVRFPVHRGIPDSAVKEKSSLVLNEIPGQ